MKSINFIRGLICGTSLLAVAGTASAIGIVNGNFEAGNTGFTSGYGYLAPAGQSTLYPEGKYTVDTNPNNVHNLWYSMGDHTSGSGNMLIVNGDSAATTVWEGNADAALTIGQTYEFSAYVASIYPVSPAQLTFSVQLFAGNTFLATLSPTPDGVWNYLYATFTADLANTGPFRLVNANFDASGNDFAVDDINIAISQRAPAVPDGGLTAMLLGMGMVGLGYVRRMVK